MVNQLQLSRHSSGWRFFLSLIALIVFTLSGCSSNPENDPAEAPELESQSLFDLSSLALIDVTVKGDSRSSFPMQAPAELELTEFLVPPRARLELAVAASQDSWLAPGDGMDFRVAVRPSDQSESETIFSRSINPKHVLDDQGWFDERISLERFAGQRITLTLNTGPGPAGDSTADQGLWAGLMVVAETERSGSQGVARSVAVYALTALVLLLLANTVRRLPRITHHARALRLAFCFTVLAIPITFACLPILQDWFKPSSTRLAAVVFVVAAIALVAVLAIRRSCCLSLDDRGKVRDRRLLKLADLLLFNGVLTITLIEVVLQLMALLPFHPIDAYEPRSGQATVKQLDDQLRPLRSLRYENGLSFNSLGFPDRDFEIPKPADTFRIAALIDSFGVMPMMPYDFNHLTLLESELSGAVGDRRVDVANLGIVGNSPASYLALLEEIGRTLDPDLVLMYFFIGNDFVPFGSEAAFASRWDRFETYRLISRLRRTSRINLPWHERATGGEIEVSIPDYVYDSSLEEPVIPREPFLQLEMRRARFFDPTLSEVHFAGAIRYIEATADVAWRLTGRPLVLVVVPEEMQVDNELRREVERRLGRSLDLTRPMNYLLENLTHVDSDRLRIIDLLPALQAAQRDRGRVYFRQETHWNALGNRIAAETVARELREQGL